MKNTTKKPGKTVTIDLPEVKDIPGQEHIKPPRIGEMGDTTISSSDEEGEGLLDDINKEEEEGAMDDQTNVTADEKKLLAKSDRPVNEETIDRDKLALDTIDTEDKWNEGSDPLDLGEDLDIPGSELDDENEDIGEEDEENNGYSQKD